MTFEWILTYALPFMAILTAIVFVHELGHYLLARWNGVKIEVFSIGFGPEFFGFNDRHGTRWKFSIIPLGGYVRMFSDADASSKPDKEKLKKLTEEEKQYSHHYKTVWQRIQISIAGPAANYIFGVVVLAILYGTAGQREPAQDALVGYVEAKGPAAEAGIQTGDKIIRVNDLEIKNFQELLQVVQLFPEKSLSVVIDREGEVMPLNVVPAGIDTKDDQGQTVTVGRLGIGQGTVLVQRGPFEAVKYAFIDVYALTAKTLKALSEMVLRKRSADELSGPIGIGKIIGDMATVDLATFFWFIAFLSINLGFINLLPIPVLDGGHLLFYIIEGILGRPLSEKAQEVGFGIGLFIILALFVFTTINDLMKLEFFQKIIGLFH